MPDPKQLLSFLGRTQTWLQRAIDEGDQEGVNYYERLMDRGDEVAKRLLAQPPAIATSPQQPVEAGPGSGDQRPGPGRMMQLSEYGQAPYNSGNIHSQPLAINPNVAPQEQQVPQPPQSPAQAVPPPQPNVSTPQGRLPQGTWQDVVTKPFVDLASINSPAKSLEVDLTNELKSPATGIPPRASGIGSEVGSSAKQLDMAKNFFSDPGKSGQAFGAMMGGQVPLTSPQSSNPEDSFMFKPLWGDSNLLMTPKEQASLVGGLTENRWFKKGDKPGQNAPGYVPGTGDNPRDAKGRLINAVPVGLTGPTGDSSDSPPSHDPASAEQLRAKDGGRYENDPSFKQRIDMMGEVKKVAKDPFEQEFLKRVERELGQKPSFFNFETLAMLLLMGAPRAYQNFKSKEAFYNQGKLGIAKEMRAEGRDKTRVDNRLEVERMRGELQTKLAHFALRPKMVNDKMAPHLQEAKSISGQIQAIERQIPAPEPGDARILQLQQRMAAALEAAAAVEQELYKGFLPPSGAKQ